MSDGKMKKHIKDIYVYLGSGLSVRSYLKKYEHYSFIAPLPEIFKYHFDGFAECNKEAAKIFFKYRITS